METETFKIYLIKCKMCRNILIELSTKYVLDGHSKIFIKRDISNCDTQVLRNELYINEENLNEWINHEIEIAEWTKGKLKCPKCTARVGSFDFVTGQKCLCHQYVLPPVHFVNSKVDFVDSIKK